MKRETVARFLWWFESRKRLAAMTYQEWLADHRAQPGGWLTTSAPDEVLAACYAERLATFDASAEEIDSGELDEEFS